MTDKVWDFPTVSVSKQLFYAAGAAIEGGFTAGGSRILSPEPGGRSALQLELSMQRDEWSSPWASWLMSKVNGQIFRVKLVFTPQLISSIAIAKPINGQYDEQNVFYQPRIKPSDLTTKFIANTLQGQTIFRFDMSQIGDMLKPGHLIGHGDNCYMIDEIQYNANLTATATVMPPARRDIVAGEILKFTPNFLGTITNGQEIRATYDAENRGMIKPGIFNFSEVIL